MPVLSAARSREWPLYPPFTEKIPRCLTRPSSSTPQRTRPRHTANCQTIDLAQVTLASFSGDDYLQNVSGGAYAQTDESGDPVLNASGTITPSSFEGSNTDIADEFIQLIVAQQAYSANARVITTANQMLQVVVNMVQ
jgi:flagellar hook protein FlgE